MILKYHSISKAFQEIMDSLPTEKKPCMRKLQERLWLLEKNPDMNKMLESLKE